MRRFLFASALLFGLALRAEEPIRVGIGTMVSLNPLLLYTEEQNQLIHLLYDRLIAQDANGNFVPQILESWKFSPDNREVILKVRPGLRWHDGHVLDADDILFTWRLLRSPKMLSLADNQAAGIPSLEKVDSLTLRIRLSRPRATLLAELYTFIPVPKGYPPIRDPNRHPYNTAPIGSGPFRIDPSSTFSRLVLIRWPEYRGPHPASWPRMEFLNLQGSAPRLVDEGKLHFTEDGNWLTHYLARSGASGFRNVITHQGTQEGFSALWFNCDPKASVLSDVRLRRALAELYPWDAITKVRSVRPLQAAGCVWPPSSWAYDGTPRPLPRRQLAESYLEEAGWRRGPGGWRQNAKGEELRLEFIHSSDLSRDLVLSAFVASARECGIRIDSKRLTFEKSIETQQMGRGDIWHVFWVNNGPDPSGDSRLFTSAGIPGTNFTHYRNPLVDQLFDDGMHASDPEQRALIYRRINQILVEDRPLLPIDYAQYFGYQHRRLKSVFYTKRGTAYGYVPGMRAWTLDNP